jgi:hypothetical protein
MICTACELLWIDVHGLCPNAPTKHEKIVKDSPERR